MCLGIPGFHGDQTQRRKTGLRGFAAGIRARNAVKRQSGPPVDISGFRVSPLPDRLPCLCTRLAYARGTSSPTRWRAVCRGLQRTPNSQDSVLGEPQAREGPGANLGQKWQ